MSPKKTRTALAALCVLLLVGASFPAHSQSLSLPSRRSVPVVPDVLLTEVLFDQTGDDTQSVFGSEWIEFYTTKSIQLDRYSIQDHQGSRLGTFPSAAVPANTYIQVILGGLDAYLLDEDASDGTFSLTLGLPAGDILSNAQNPGEGGGVRLLENGSIVDQVYWGHGSAPIGSGGAGGEFFDVSFAAGKPINEADSLGRSVNPLADYTGTIADWERNGGINAAGPTPNGRNGVHPSDKDSILKWVQAGVCDIVNSFAYMTGQQNKYRFLDATVSNIVVDDLGSSLTVTATHTFSLNVNRNVTTLSGVLMATLLKDESAGSVSFTRTASGNLSSPAGWGLEIDYSQTIAGFHTNTLTAGTSVAVVYQENGQDYPFSHGVTKSLRRIADDAWVLQDDRTAVDYGGASSKMSTATTTYTRLGDGTIAASFDMLRDMPIGPPLPGEQGSIDFRQRLVIKTVSSGDDLGSETTTILRYDEYEDSTLVATLQTGQSGSAALTFEGSSAEEPLGSANFQATLPLSVEGIDRTLSMAVRATLGLRPDGTYVGQADGQLNVNGLLSNAFTFWADPPLRDGSSGGSSNSGNAGGFSDAAVNCATKGGAIGGGVGAVGGGVAGAIGGTAVGTAVGALGGPPGAVAGATAGGVKGTAIGVVIGSAAGGIAGAGIGAAACMTGYGAKKAWRGVKSAWNWVFN